MGKRMHQIRLQVVDVLTSMLSALATEYADGSDLYFSYRLLLGRKPDKFALNSWAQLIADGVPREEIISRLLNSNEHSQKIEKDRIARVVLDGFTIFVDSTDPSIGGAILKYKIYEPHVMTVLKKLLKPNHVFLDIGASIGWFTLMTASLLSEGRVFAVEPAPNNLRLLYRSIVANGFSNVTVLPYAATDMNTLLQFSQGISNNVVQTIDKTNAHIGEYVPGVKIDDFLDPQLRVDVIKIDVEGHELKALNGMHRLLTIFHPVIVSEFNPKAMREFAGIEPGSYLQALDDLGYKLAVIQGDGSELDFERSADILEHWKQVNRVLDPIENRYHLDIVARPI